VASLVLGVLVGFRRASARHGGQVKLAALQPVVRSTFEGTGLLALFRVADTVDEALRVSAYECLYRPARITRNPGLALMEPERLF
jgi:anti-anti-sigma regulatory factor